MRGLAGRFGRRWRAEEVSRPRQPSALAGVGEDTVVPHAYEAPRDDVGQKTARELRPGHRLGLALAAVVSVLVREGDVVVAMLEKPLVRDGDAVGVAAEVAQDLLRPRHRGLAVDDEVLRGSLT